MEVQRDLLLLTAHQDQLSIQVHWYAYSLYWKKIISSSTLGHCFCGLGICYFIPTCWHNISSLNRHPAMKSSEEHYCSTDCFLALYCVVIARWIARLAQAHSVCVRNRKGDFFLPCFSYQLFLTSPFASYKSEVFVNVILSGNSKGRITDSSPKWNYCFFLPSYCQRRAASDATCPRGHWPLQQLAGSAGSWGLPAQQFARLWCFISGTNEINIATIPNSESRFQNTSKLTKQIEPGQPGGRRLPPSLGDTAAGVANLC